MPHSERTGMQVPRVLIPLIVIVTIVLQGIVYLTSVGRCGCGFAHVYLKAMSLGLVCLEQFCDGRKETRGRRTRVKTTDAIGGTHSGR